MNFSRCMQMFSRYRAVSRLVITVAYMKGDDDFKVHNRNHNSWLDWLCGSCGGGRIEKTENSVDYIQRRLKENQKELEIQKEFEFYCQLQQIVNEFEKFDNSYKLDYLKGLIEVKSKHIGKKIPAFIEKKDENMKFFKTLVTNGKLSADRNTISMVLVALALDVAKNANKKERSVVMRHQDASSGALHILLSHPEDMMELIPQINELLLPPNIQEFLKKYEEEKQPGALKKELTKEEKQVKDQEKNARVEAAKEWFRQEGNIEYRRANISNELLLLNYLRDQMKKKIHSHNFHVVKFGPTRFSISFQVTTASGEQRTLTICLRCDDGAKKAVVWTSAKDGKNQVNIEAFEIVTAYLE